MDEAGDPLGSPASPTDSTRLGLTSLAIETTTKKVPQP